MGRLRLNIASKFFATLAVVGPLIVAVAVVGARGLSDMRHEADLLFKDNIHTTEVTDGLGSDLAHADEVARRLVLAEDRHERQGLEAQLDQTVVPAVDTGIATLRRLHAGDDAYELGPIERIARGWQKFLKLRDSIRPAGSMGPAAQLALTREVSAIFDPLRDVTNDLSHVEAEHASQAHARAIHTYSTSQTVIMVIAALALLVGLGSVVLLIRNVVPRVTAYSGFATRVARGDLSGRLRPRGRDELAQLGTALNEMVDRRASDVAFEDLQAEFVDTLQVTETEEEAHELLKRQVERAVPDSHVVVLNRNNSADRLEATTEEPADSPLAQSLPRAKPRSCLAVRFARAHAEGPDRDPLMNCELCGKTPEHALCEPLLVGGEVIGSVLVRRERELGDRDSRAVQESVNQAAPVLANLRNLAIAERRAATDALTGLPNDRAVRDTIKRMVAQASRTTSPLAAVLLDLDHFKQINDTFGHDRGDDVLAAVGSVLQSAVRESDFVGRYGGEEFVLLLPATAAENAVIVAEKVRAAIGQVTVPGVERAITASLGVAGLPEHAGDADSLIRAADRALYTAKGNGRDRVVVASVRPGISMPDPSPDGEGPELEAAPTSP